MRQLTVTSPGAIAWQEVADPVLTGPTAALVEPVAVATCDFDHLIVSGLTPLDLPLGIGHECVARVVEVGAAVTAVASGDTVVVPYQVSCGRCDACRRGHTASCAEVPWLSCYGLGPYGGGWGGAMADVVAIPYADAMLVPVPAGVSHAAAAAVSCNLVDAYRCVDALADRPGAPVLVVGGGFNNIARYCIVLALALGSAKVDYFDRDPERARRAASLGATVVETITPGAYPITVDASMDVQLLDLTIRATAPSGVCTLSTMYPFDAVPVPLYAMFEHAVTLRTGQPHVRALIEPVLDLIAAGAFDPLALIDDVVDWEDGPAAFTTYAGKTVCVR